MGNDLGDELEKFVSWARSVDKETHYEGKSWHRSGRVYDVDWVNLKRILTGKEAADIYQALEKHNKLLLTSGPLEHDPSECVSIENGVRYVPVGEVFATGYYVNLIIDSILSEENDKPERILTFSEHQLPYDIYKKLFANFLKSKTNFQRARDLGLERISNFAGGEVN